MRNEPIEIIESPAHFECGVWVEHQTLKVYMDTEPDSPRNWDNFGHMVCFHNRYDLGDKHGLSHDDFDSWDELEQYLIKEKGAIAILPLYLYDHGGITMRTHSFNDRWDSGQVGFIYATKKDITENWTDVKRVTKSSKERAIRLLQAEVETYDDYLTGNVYGYVVENEEGDELFSCWGFFGDDAIEEIKSQVHIHPAKPATGDGTSGSSGECEA